jgi:hypothetical protein
MARLGFTLLVSWRRGGGALGRLCGVELEAGLGLSAGLPGNDAYPKAGTVSEPAARSLAACLETAEFVAPHLAPWPRRTLGVHAMPSGQGSWLVGIAVRLYALRRPGRERSPLPRFGHLILLGRECIGSQKRTLCNPSG